MILAGWALVLALLLSLASGLLVPWVPLRGVMALQELGCVLLPALLAARLSGMGGEALQLRRSGAVLPLLTAALAALLLPPLGKLMELEMRLLPDLEELARGLEEMVRASGAADLLLVLLLAAALPALAEELLFRGLLLWALAGRFRPAMAILIQAFLFGLAHLHPARLLPMLLLGIFLGWAVLRAGTVWVGVAGHFVFNALIVLAANAGQESGPAGSVPWGWVAGALALFAAGAALLARLTRPAPSAAVGEPSASPPGEGEPGAPSASSLPAPSGGGSETRP